jgi:hypothetical protein
MGVVVAELGLVLEELVAEEPLSVDENEATLVEVADVGAAPEELLDETRLGG